MENFWSICLDRFKQELSAQQFNTWIKPLKCEPQKKGALRLLAPNRFVQQWVKDRFLRRIELLAEELLSQPVAIELAVAEGEAVSIEPEKRSQPRQETVQEP
ncbi:MAG TPA: DnaA N-terminal domain-containing protein, partial [Methylophilaceae bacterium]|nr:DnaA N-terminal domain-containing protein [Methylophilaceae bacterium]